MNPLTRFITGSRRVAARIYRTARTRKDEWLHPLRHRRAKERVSRLTRPCRVVVVCYGNICRSPYLEAVLRQSLPDCEISSAGLMGPGRAVPSHGMTVAARRGFDLSPHRSRLLTPKILNQVDLAIVMDAHQARHLSRALGFSSERLVIAGDLDPAFDESRAIRDPWQQALSVFESSYARLERVAATLALILAEGRGPARTGR